LDLCPLSPHKSNFARHDASLEKLWFWDIWKWIKLCLQNMKHLIQISNNWYTTTKDQSGFLKITLIKSKHKHNVNSYYWYFHLNCIFLQRIQKCIILSQI
jgi:hypothetical protein